MELSVFQKKCKTELFNRFQIENFKILESDKTRFAEKEVFIEASVNDLRIWIYEDGAHIKSPDINMAFEDLDYPDDDEMLRAFIDRIASVLSN